MSLPSHSFGNIEDGWIPLGDGLIWQKPPVGGLLGSAGVGVVIPPVLSGQRQCLRGTPHAAGEHTSRGGCLIRVAYRRRPVNLGRVAGRNKQVYKITYPNGKIYVAWT